MAGAKSVIEHAAAGACAGLVATWAMSLFMVAAQRPARMGTQPPKRIVARGFEIAGMPKDPDVLDPVSVGAHFAYGGGCGMLYGAVAGRGAAAWSGVLYGLGIWAVSYAGWIPAFGILPPPTRDRPGRAFGIVAAHVVYGAVLGNVMSHGQRK